MRIAVVSDTHGNINSLLKAIKKMGNFDLLIHLGDYVKDGEKLKTLLSIPAVIVKGNGDYSSGYKEDETIDINGKKIFLTHGHKYNVSWGYTSLYYRGLEIGAHIVLYGHTHIPVNLQEENMIIMNPGSASLPRTSDRIRTFGIINLTDTIGTEIVNIWIMIKILGGAVWDLEDTL